MAIQIQDGGWPLGLVRNLDFSGSLTFTLSSSSVSSSDLDTESSRSFFYERRSITLGSLIGFSDKQDSLKGKKNQKSKACLSLCSMTQLINCQKASSTPPSLGHFLEEERRRNQNLITYELHGLPDNKPSPESSNTLFSNGFIVPPKVGEPVTVRKQTCWL
ncbi:hypothetical protein IHE45_07G125300 [Dioscorea alata]|nr:hypothetical protein IHE45_07G125300 [Dioscorea alata]